MYYVTWQLNWILKCIPGVSGMESALIFTCVMADARACARASTCSSAQCAGSGVSWRCTLPINKKMHIPENKSVTFQKTKVLRRVVRRCILPLQIPYRVRCLCQKSTSVISKESSRQKSRTLFDRNWFHVGHVMYVTRNPHQQNTTAIHTYNVTVTTIQIHP